MSTEIKPTIKPAIEIFTALLDQDGSDAPVCTVLQNTLRTGTPIWTRFSAGIYRATLANAFPEFKTIVIFQNTHSMANFSYTWISPSEIQIATGGDDRIYHAPIEIRVYNF